MSGSEKNLCVCGSGHLEADCCGPLIGGLRRAETAVALMRSRYSAYVKGNAEYLQKSWHPKYRPEELNLDSDQITWQGLEIVSTRDGLVGDTQGVVEFIARFERAGKTGMVQEHSRFLYENGQWLYLDGDLKSPEKLGRNSPCPCGSGKKYKRCCGQ